MNYYKWLPDCTTITCNDAQNVQICTGVEFGSAIINCNVEQLRRLGILLQHASDDIVRQSVNEVIGGAL